MSEYDIFQIDVVKGYGMTELNHGLKDLKTCLMKCGNEQKSRHSSLQTPGSYGCVWVP